MTKSDILLVGGGGHCRSCIDVIEQEDRYRIAGIVDLPEKVGQDLLGYPILASDAELPRLVQDYGHFLITLGQIKSPALRIAIFHRLKELGAILPTIVSPLAYVSRHASVGEGTIVMHRSVVNAGAQVGRNCILNTFALIEHDALIGDHCHISTAAVLNGGTRVADGVFIGSNATTRQGIEIGPGTVVGAGVGVMNDLPAGTIYKGTR